MRFVIAVAIAWFSVLPAWAAEWTAIDGDTLRKGDRRVRIYGIDAPETHKPGCAAEKALGAQAQDFLRARLASGPVRVIGVKRKTRDGRIVQNRDKYGRDLARVYVQGKNVGDELIAAGLAKPYFGKTKEGWCQ